MSENPRPVDFSDLTVDRIAEAVGLRPVPTLDERAEAFAGQLAYILEAQYGLNASEIHVLVRILLQDTEFMRHEVFRSGCAILLERFQSSPSGNVDLAKVARVRNISVDILLRFFDFGTAEDEELTF
jgi:hypothetical protein